MSDHQIHFTLADLPDALAGIKTIDDPDAILQAFRDHLNTGKPESVEINALDSRGTYTNTVIVRLSKVASIQVSRAAVPESFKITLTTAAAAKKSTKKKSVKKAARKTAVKKSSR